MHILPPVPKPKKHPRVSLHLESSVYRSGRRSSGSVFTSSLRCSAQAVARTEVPEEILECEPNLVSSRSIMVPGSGLWDQSLQQNCIRDGSQSCLVSNVRLAVHRINSFVSAPNGTLTAA